MGFWEDAEQGAEYVFGFKRAPPGALDQGRQIAGQVAGKEAESIERDAQSVVDAAKGLGDDLAKGASFLDWLLENPGIVVGGILLIVFLK